MTAIALECTQVLSNHQITCHLLGSHTQQCHKATFLKTSTENCSNCEIKMFYKVLCSNCRGKNTGQTKNCLSQRMRSQSNDLKNERTCASALSK